MSYTVERLIKFKTVPSRWEPQSICDTKEQADDMVLMYTTMLSKDSRANGGRIVAYRVKDHSYTPKLDIFDEFAERAPKDVQEAMIKILNARTTRAKHEQGLDKV
jgi:hypothetical protein